VSTLAYRPPVYQRLLDRRVPGILTTMEAMDSDPGAAVVAELAYTTKLAQRVREKQDARLTEWA
jgi:hypothetical protein